MKRIIDIISGRYFFVSIHAKGSKDFGRLLVLWERSKSLVPDLSIIVRFVCGCKK